MKRFLLIPSCALFALSVLASCQKEEKTVTELAQELTNELQQISDYKTAEAHAPGVEVLNKRLQNAGVRVFALQATSLQRGADETEGGEGVSYAEALSKLAAEVARVQAGTPGTVDGSIDRDKLVLAVGAANGAGDSAPASKRKAAGLKYYQNASDASETPGPISEFYGSARLREALDYTAEPDSVSMFQFDEDVQEVPTAAPVVEDEEDGSSEETPSEDDAVSDDSTGGATPGPAPSDASSASDADDISLDDETPSDDSTSSDTATSDDDVLPSLDSDDSSSSDEDSGSDDLDLGI